MAQAIQGADKTKMDVIQQLQDLAGQTKKASFGRSKGAIMLTTTGRYQKKQRLGV
jgi:hypothetical protein